jgi:ABC-type nitrate/sulfonate/bicarbonate transport system ATPase subunit
MKFELTNSDVYANEHPIFQDLNLSVASGEIVSILGPSGCGKTTLLRVSCGLTALAHGERRLDGALLENQTIVPDITMLFQQPVLYPHLNVAQNIGLGAPSEWSKKEKGTRIDEVLTSIGMDGFGQRGVASLSGGEAQRVAFGRALMQEPKVMLLDEPFASVDVARRLELAAMTRRHLKQRGITAIHVTHDEDEADIMADRVIRWTELQPSTPEGEEE